MASEIRIKDTAEAAFTITIDSLASGSGRSSAAVTNSNDQPAALISVQVTTGSAPTAGTVYEVFLLRDLGTLATDGWGGTDAAFTPVNADRLGQIVVTAAGTTAHYGVFDTWRLGPLGPTFGIAVKNATNLAAHSSGHAAYYNYYVPEAQ